MTELLEKLTIAIPVYNDVKYIGRTIEACLKEAGRIVIYDNASDDGSSEVCAAFAKEHTHVTHLRHEQNIGFYENFRYALFDCDTEYFCWLGSHDLLEKNYSLPLLKALEKEPDVALAVGTIQHVDENGNNLSRVTRSHWVNRVKNKTRLARMDAFAKKLRDCFMVYGIFRTGALKGAWQVTPMLGFDRVLLMQIAGAGKVIYVPASIFYARNLDQERKGSKDQERRAAILNAAGGGTAEKSLMPRNMGMVKAVLDCVQDDKDLKKALKIIDKINRRYVNRRYFQKLRTVKIIAALLLGVLLFWLWRI